MNAIAEIYARVPRLLRAVPLVALLVFAAELLQHGVEIQLGMYRPGAALSEEAQATRLAFGAIKVLAIFLALLFALRWWRFDGDSRRAARPTLALLKGLAVVALIQVGGELLVMALVKGLGAALGPLRAGGEAALLVSALLAWLFAATLLYPWYVGLLTEDPTMTLRRSVRATLGRMWARFGLLLAGLLPAMLLHYAIGYGAIGRPEPLVWLLMLVDAGVVALLALLIASTYFSLYEKAARRVPA